MQSLEKPVSPASLAVFRILFGVMILIAMIRFGTKGWIDTLYIQPDFFFKYYGFEWVQPIGVYTKWLFVLCGLCALLFALGLFYRLSAVCLFLSFTYIELMDKTNYLNHYYFVSLVLFLMIWLPANAGLALDNIRKPTTRYTMVPLWSIACLRFLLSLVYIFAGLAKLNSDWLLEAMPLKLWLPAKNDLFLLGSLFNKEWVAYVFSWFGAVYDLTIPFFLLKKKTRPFAYVIVIVFHMGTAFLFPIGMFPYVMILATLIFFPTVTLQAWIENIKRSLGFRMPVVGANAYQLPDKRRSFIKLLLFVFFGVQLILPWRYLAYPGELFWTEQGYRFSWRVMLIEKVGYAEFTVKDPDTHQYITVNNSQFLTINQEKMMATQADFMLQYAHYLYRYYKQNGMKDPKVFAKVYVGLNGRRSRLFIDPDVDLAKEKDNFSSKKWIQPLNDKIYGL